jgi:iron-sulfur cluster assembly accessory protein
MLSVTPRAAQALKAFLEKEGQPNQALRIVAQPGGCCSGATYGVFFEKEKAPEDVVLQHDGVTIYLDQFSDSLLAEAKLDYEDGPQGQVFFIDNPRDQQHGREGGTCGCAEEGGSCGCTNGSCGCHEH